jgi:integrase
MASITNDPNGRKRIQFVDGEGIRKSIRLGKATVKQAEAFKVKVESLIGGMITGSTDDETSRWLAGLDDRTYSKLTAVGLAKSRNGERAMLAAFIDLYIQGRSDIKPRTLINVKQVRRLLVGCFGEKCNLRAIGPSEAEDFRLYMLKAGLGENTIRRHIGRARQLFKAAIRRGMVRGANPFEGMAATVRADKARMFFITREDAAKVLDACPDAEWRLLFALSRYGGLRCPSEHLALKWSDVDWDKGRIRVPSSKTEHHEGKESRMIPMFPELRSHLLEVFEQAEPGTEYVINRYRSANANLRTQLLRIISKAGVVAWPKPWHNLRSTRQTELAEKYPIHVVCAWLGNSRAVAQEHYLQITDAHFAQAIVDGVSVKTGDGERAAHNAAQYPPESSRIEQEAVGCGTQNHADFPSDSAPYEIVQVSNYPRQDSNL